MRREPLFLVLCCFCGKLLSYQPKQCDVRFWHVGVMEQLLNQETKMSQRQMSMLEKIEQLMQRVQHEEPPMMPCSLLHTYGSILLPNGSVKLLEDTIKKTEESLSEGKDSDSSSIEEDGRGTIEVEEREMEISMTDNHGENRAKEIKKDENDTNIRERDQTGGRDKHEGSEEGGSIKKEANSADDATFPSGNTDDMGKSEIYGFSEYGHFLSSEKGKETNTGGVTIFYEDDEEDETDIEDDLYDAEGEANRYDDFPRGQTERSTIYSQSVVEKEAGTVYSHSDKEQLAQTSTTGKQESESENYETERNFEIFQSGSTNCSEFSFCPSPLMDKCYPVQTRDSGEGNTLAYEQENIDLSTGNTDLHGAFLPLWFEYSMQCLHSNISALHATCQNACYYFNILRSKSGGYENVDTADNADKLPEQTGEVDEMSGAEHNEAYDSPRRDKTSSSENMDEGRPADEMLKLKEPTDESLQLGVGSEGSEDNQDSNEQFIEVRDIKRTGHSEGEGLEEGAVNNQYDDIISRSSSLPVSSALEEKPPDHCGDFPNHTLFRKNIEDSLHDELNILEPTTVHVADTRKNNIGDNIEESPNVSQKNIETESTNRDHITKHYSSEFVHGHEYENAEIDIDFNQKSNHREIDARSDGNKEQQETYSKRDSSKSVEFENLHKLMEKKEKEQTSKIQSLELMIVKLENKILEHTVNKRDDSNTYVNLENQILKLENELLKLNQSYRKLHEDHKEITSHYNKRFSYMELDYKKMSPVTPNYPALADNSTKELISLQEAKLSELSNLLLNQSLSISRLQSRSENLEEQNQKLFHIVMNQTALITQIMARLQDLGEEGIQAKLQAEVFKSKLEQLTIKRESRQNSVDSGGHDMSDGRLVQQRTDVSVKSSSKSSSTKSHGLLFRILAVLMRSSPSADTPKPAFERSWTCSGNNSPRLCVLQSMVVTNCAPFQILQWLRCSYSKGSIIYDDRDQIIKAPAREEYEEKIVNGPMIAKGNEAEAVSVQRAYNENDYDEVVIRGSRVDGSDEKSRNKDDSEDHDYEETTLNRVRANSRDDKPRAHENISNESDDKNVDEEIIAETSEQLKKGSSNKRNMNPTSFPSYSQAEVGSEDSYNSVNEERFGQGHSPAVTSWEDERKRVDQDDSFSKDATNEHNTHSTESTQHGCANGALGCGAHEFTATSPGAAESKEDARRDSTPERRVQDNIDQPGGGWQDKRETEEVAGERKKEIRSGKDQGLTLEQEQRLQAVLHREILYEPEHKNRAHDCYELYKQGETRDGMKQVFVAGLNVYVSVHCDMDSGGWTTLLRREDVDLDFYRDFDQYKDGFGGPRDDHYIGNEVIHYMTNQKHYSLRVELTDWEGNSRHAHYDHFWLEAEEEAFKLNVFGYSGDAGDGLTKHNGHKFSTYDVDNDKLKTELGGSCAKRFHGAGWYYKCYSSNLMGRYYEGGTIPEKRHDGITWKPWRGSSYSMKTATMAIRPMGAMENQ